MNPRPAARATAFGLSLLVTFAMLGSVNFLATQDTAPAAVMAAAGAPRA